MITIIIAVDSQGGFGKDGKIPWHFKEDFAWFKKQSKDKVCVMGRHTYEDMLSYAKKRDITKGILPDRTSYVISNTKPDDHFKGAERVDGLRNVREKHVDEEIMILGGEKLYTQALAWADKVLITVIDKSYDCDRFFPVNTLETKFNITDGEKVTAEDGTELLFMTYEKK